MCTCTYIFPDIQRWTSLCSLLSLKWLRWFSAHLFSYCCWATNVTWMIYTDKSSGFMTLNLNLNQATARPFSFLCLQVTDEFMGLFSYEERPFSTFFSSTLNTVIMLLGSRMARLQLQPRVSEVSPPFVGVIRYFTWFAYPGWDKGQI